VRPLNVATEPFRNRRLPILLVSLLTVTTAALTVAHGLTLARLLPSHLQKTEAVAGALDSELSRLRAERERLRSLRPAKEDLERWNLVRDLVDRRLFRWTELLARLGQIVPDGVVLTAIEPVMQSDGAEVHLSATSAMGGTKALLDLVRRLEGQPDFDDAAPESISKADKGETIVLRVRYRPITARDKSAPVATPTPEASR
jgi:Tfp pilus assembly protein PilN